MARRVAGKLRRAAEDRPQCSTVVIAATGEPSTLIPPLVSETVARDISDQIYERLAYLSPVALRLSRAPTDRGWPSTGSALTR